MNRRESSALQQGSATVVCLPADWVRGNGVRYGDKLLVEYDADSVTVRLKRPPQEAP